MLNDVVINIRKKGDLSARVSFAGTDELASLSKEINFMLESLENSSEKRFHTLFDQASDSIVIFNANTGDLLDFNKKAYESLGYKHKEFKKIKLSDIEVIEAPSEIAMRMKKIKDEGEDTFETKHRTKSGHIRDILVNAKLIQFREGKYIQAIWRDVTDSKKAEEELVKIQKLESIGVLAGGIAHDFNNLLSALRSYVNLSKMNLDQENKSYKHLESAEIIIDRAADLTHQLLTFSKGGAPVKKIASIIEIIHESAEFALKGSSISCEYNTADNLSKVEVDPGQISQVLHNLVLNALQSMPEGGTISISTENVNISSDTGLLLQKGKYVKIIVKDQGIGIAEGYLKKIFDPYFSTKEAGRGLGLSVTYSIIKNHDGHILAESELGVGSTFTIYLPASEKQDIEKETLEDTFTAGEGKVLIMDDEEIIRKSFEQLLTIKGYQVECARDGEEAIELYKNAMGKSQSFDVVILDLTIRGGMGGEETLKKLKDIDLDVKAIVASGYSNDTVLANYRDYGFCGIFAKHDKTEELVKVIHKVINGYQ
jgi:PAS domain S-box-containing protein